jgi:hypothetical protein
VGWLLKGRFLAVTMNSSLSVAVCATSLKKHTADEEHQNFSFQCYKDENNKQTKKILMSLIKPIKNSLK